MSSLLLLSLLTTFGAAGCAADPASTEDGRLTSVSQEWGPDGFNGIPPEVLSGDYLRHERLLEFGLITPEDPALAPLCVTYLQGKCELNPLWGHWLNPDAADPPDPDSVLRWYLLEAMIHGSMDLNVLVHIPGWTGDSEFINGMFGVFPNWVKVPLKTDAQELISGFIAAKVNAFGGTVPIGIIAPGPAAGLPDPVKDEQFAFQEGVFFGNLFSDAPKIYSCLGAGPGSGQHAIGQEQRVCAQPGNPCNIEWAGDCHDVCEAGFGNQGIPNGEYCQAATTPGGVYAFPLTVNLKLDE